MLEIFSDVTMNEVMQVIAPALFLFGVLASIVIALYVFALIFRAEARAEAKAAIKSFARSVKSAAQFLF